eukprot:329175-Chlamydomonas_euryale.AAC.1
MSTMSAVTSAAAAESGADAAHCQDKADESVLFAGKAGCYGLLDRLLAKGYLTPSPVGQGHPNFQKIRPASTAGWR